jgi:hypothetical protein
LNRVRFLSALAILVLATAVAVCAQKQPTDKWSPQVKEVATKMSQAIREEIKSLKDHPWAGEYYEGDGLGMNISLAIAPKSGYVFAWHGCGGLYELNYGPVDWKNEQVRLSTIPPNKTGDFFRVFESLIPVTWGPRRYLIPADRMIDFCNGVNSGAEPRKHVYGMFLLRDGDEQKSVTGLPTVPKKYRRYLLDKPITAEITAVGKQLGQVDQDVKRKGTAVTVNAGEASGLLPGMELLATSSNENHDMTVEITKVEKELSYGVVWQVIETDRYNPKVGYKLSTRAWWRPIR